MNYSRQSCGCPRVGFTLLELVVVVAIVALVLSLLMAAVVRVREAANITQSKNNLRQIILATHHFASTHQGRLPVVGNDFSVQLVSGLSLPQKQNPALWVEILPYLEGQSITSKKKKLNLPPVPLFLSPSDPTVDYALAKKEAVSSYAANAEVFKDSPSLIASFLDGTSNTIAFAEHYAGRCNKASFVYWEPACCGMPHRATFADGEDVGPVTQGNPPVTTASPKPKLNVTVHTFQVAPSISECRMAVPQTPHASGMLVAMADGCVRQLTPAITPSLFWGAVTPNKSEILSGDW
jgi:prepilin-type N-terminal cleavage/methylation domain-containing protein